MIRRLETWLAARIAALDGCKFAMAWDSRMLPKRLVRELLCRTDLAQFSAVVSDLSERITSVFSRDPGAKSGMLTARIYNHFALPFASRVVSQVTNGCAAHDWGQLLTLRVKTCSLFGSFTNHLDCRLSPQKGAVQAAIINHPPARGITLQDAMRFAGDEMLRIRLEGHVIVQFKAPNRDALLRQVHPKVLPAWPMDLEKGQELLQGYLPAWQMK